MASIFNAADSFASFFDTTIEADQSSLYLSKCNQFGRFPILPLAPQLETRLCDGNLSDDSCSPVTPLDAYDFGLHTLSTQKFDLPFDQHCLSMADLYLPPPAPLSDIESSPSPSPSSTTASLPSLALLAPPVAPSQTPSPVKREAPEDDSESVCSASPAKKPRIATERIRAKDFIMPDTAGLTKREARLVKNRAAAFLSRQRKREEFETMEARVAELERENARLAMSATADGASPASAATPEDSSPIQRQLSSLQSMLAASEERERCLQRELEQLRTEADSQSSSSGSPPPRTPSPATEEKPTSVFKALSAMLRGNAGDFEFACTPGVDGRIRVQIQRATAMSWGAEDLALRNESAFLEDMFPLDGADVFSYGSQGRRMRVCLSGTNGIHGDAAELELEIQ